MLIVVLGGVHALSHAHTGGVSDCATCRLAHEPCAPVTVPATVLEVSDSGFVVASVAAVSPSDEGPLQPHVPRAPPR
jgi:hypothetical protein